MKILTALANENINKKLEEAAISDANYRYISEGKTNSISSNIIARLIKESEDLNK